MDKAYATASGGGGTASLSGTKAALSAPNLKTYTIVNTQVTALGSVLTGVIPLDVIPNGWMILGAYVNVTAAETALTTLTASLGTATGVYIDLMPATAVNCQAVSVRGMYDLSLVPVTPITVAGTTGKGDSIGFKLTGAHASKHFSDCVAFAATVYLWVAPTF